MTFGLKVVQTKMKEVLPADSYLNVNFSPCNYCSNVFSDVCLDDCSPERKYKRFKRRPGIGIKDLPAFPEEDMQNAGDAYYRLVVVTLYMSAIVDYLQYQEEYEFRESAKGKDKKVPDLRLLTPEERKRWMK